MRLSWCSNLVQTLNPVKWLIAITHCDAPPWLKMPLLRLMSSREVMGIPHWPYVISLIARQVLLILLNSCGYLFTSYCILVYQYHILMVSQFHSDLFIFHRLWFLLTLVYSSSSEIKSVQIYNEVSRKRYKVMQISFDLFFMFSNFDQWELQEKSCVPVANLWNISENWIENQN